VLGLIVICRDRPSLPFRCLDPQYRRELVRVYLTNVEGICRRFVDEKRESLLRMKETTASFKAYWASQTANDKKALVQHKGSDMLKVRAAVMVTHYISVRAVDLACLTPLLLYRCGSPVMPVSNHSVAVADLWTWVSAPY